MFVLLVLCGLAGFLHVRSQRPKSMGGRQTVPKAGPEVTKPDRPAKPAAPAKEKKVKVERVKDLPPVISPSRFKNRKVPGIPGGGVAAAGGVGREGGAGMGNPWQSDLIDAGEDNDRGEEVVMKDLVDGKKKDETVVDVDQESLPGAMEDKGEVGGEAPLDSDSMKKPAVPEVGARNGDQDVPFQPAKERVEEPGLEQQGGLDQPGGGNQNQPLDSQNQYGNQNQSPGNQDQSPENQNENQPPEGQNWNQPPEHRNQGQNWNQPQNQQENQNQLPPSWNQHLPSDQSGNQQQQLPPSENQQAGNQQWSGNWQSPQSRNQQSGYQKTANEPIPAHNTQDNAPPPPSQHFNQSASRNSRQDSLYVHSSMPLGSPLTSVQHTERQRAVVEAFRHAWKGYKDGAWGRDEVNPVSQTPSASNFGMGMTLVDTLDTLWLMGLTGEFQEAREWVDRKLNIDHNSRTVSLFETNIRILGGLLSAYHLSRDHVFLDKAVSPARTRASG